MKRKLAFFLAVAMLVTMLPSSIFAASKNTITDTLDVSDDAEFSAVKDLDDAPRLQIEVETEMKKDGAFSLMFTNAEVDDEDDNFMLTNDKYIKSDTYKEVKQLGFARDGNDIYFAVGTIAGGEAGEQGAAGVAPTKPGTRGSFEAVHFEIQEVEQDNYDLKFIDYVEFTEQFAGTAIEDNYYSNKIAFNSAEIKTNENDGYNPSYKLDSFKFRIPLVSRVVLDDAETGDIKVRIKSGTSTLTGNTHTYARAVTGAYRAEIKTKDLEDNTNTLNALILEELNSKAFDLKDDQYIEIKLPSNYEFKNIKTDAANTKTAKDVLNTNEVAVVYSQGFDSSTAVCNVTLRDDDTVMRLTFPTGLKGSRAGRLAIYNIKVRPEKDASYGDVEVSISGNIDKKTLKIGAYRDYGLSLKVENKDVPTILAGKYPGAMNDNGTLKDKLNINDADDAKTLKMTLEETIPNSWSLNRKTTFEVPEGVKIIGAKVKLTNVDKGKVTSADEAGIAILGDSSNSKAYKSDDLMFGSKRNEAGNDNLKVELENATKKNSLIVSGGKNAERSKAKMELTLWVTAEAGFTGDVEVKVTGGGFNKDLSAVVAKVISPLEIVTKKNEVKIGKKSMVINDIEIKENKAGAISKVKDATDLVLWSGDVDENDTEWLKLSNVRSYEVTEGDINIDTVKTGRYSLPGSDRKISGILIELKSKSDKASTIKLKEIAMSLDRTPPEGLYSLSLGGHGLVQNYYGFNNNSTKGGLFEKEAFVYNDIFNVITPAPGEENKVWARESSITFVNSEASVMLAGDKQYALEPAAYIDAVANRTMVPLRTAAIALGIPESQIGWDAVTRTASIRKDNTVAAVRVVKSGQKEDKTIYINGSPYKQMDIAPVMKDNKAFLPVSAFADVLGVPYLWDQATRTAIFNPTKASEEKYPNAIKSYGEAVQVAEQPAVTETAVENTEASEITTTETSTETTTATPAA